MARNFFVGYEEVFTARRYAIVEVIMNYLDDEYELPEHVVSKVKTVLEQREIKQSTNQIKTEASVLYWLADLLQDPSLGPEYETIVQYGEEGRSYAKRALELYWRLAEAGFTWGQSAIEENLRTRLAAQRQELLTRDAEIERLSALVHRIDAKAAAEAGLVARKSWEQQRDIHQLPSVPKAFGHCRRIEYTSEFRARFCALSHSVKAHCAQQIILLTEEGRKRTKLQMGHGRYEGRLEIRAFAEVWCAEVSDQYRVLWSREGDQHNGFVLTFHFIGAVEEV